MTGFCISHKLNTNDYSVCIKSIMKRIQGYVTLNISMDVIGPYPAYDRPLTLKLEPDR